MDSFASARKNMVDGQIHPSGIIDERILNIFGSLPREDYVPENLKTVAYYDEDLIFDDKDNFLMEPTTHSKLLQAANIDEDDVVLDVGCGLGYSSAVLSQMVTTVFALEDDLSCLEIAQKTWNSQDLCNIVSQQGALDLGIPDNGPYDAIILNGAVAAIPDVLKNQLAVGGRLVCVLRTEGKIVGQATLIQRINAEHFSSKTLFDAATPYLHSLSPTRVFQF